MNFNETSNIFLLRYKALSEKNPDIKKFTPWIMEKWVWFVIKTYDLIHLIILTCLQDFINCNMMDFSFINFKIQHMRAMRNRFIVPRFLFKIYKVYKKSPWNCRVWNFKFLEDENCHQNVFVYHFVNFMYHFLSVSTVQSQFYYIASKYFSWGKFR